MVGKLRFAWGCAAVVALWLTAGQATAGTVYHTSVSNSANQFWAYDTATNTWTRKNDFQTGSTLAVDSQGNLFAYAGNRTAIVKYDPAADTWSSYLAAPTLDGSTSSYGLYNLEITNTGRFLLTGNGLTDLYYSDGGAWSSVALGFKTNATGDYDPTTGLYALTPLSGTSPKLIDPETFAITSFTGTGNGGDWRRSGTILNGQYFIQTSASDVEAWDLSDPNAAPDFITSTPSDLYWMASAADRENGYLYATNYVTNRFYCFDGTSWIALANVGATQFDHTTIAYVPDAVPVPEPGTLALLGLGAVGAVIGRVWRRGRK